MKSTRTWIKRMNRISIVHFRRPHGIPVPRVHALHPEGVSEEGADLRASVDFREGGGLRHGQVRQEARQGQLPAELRDALPHRDRVSVQVRPIGNCNSILARLFTHFSDCRNTIDRSVEPRLHLSRQPLLLFLLCFSLHLEYTFEYWEMIAPLAEGSGI